MSGLDAALTLLVREAQAERIPSVNAAVVRDGETIWSEAVGFAEPGRSATADDQYRIGSITKTFCAVAVLQLRDAGELDLDDPIERHLPESAHGSITIRHLLAHASGIEREPAGQIWETLAPPDGPAFLASLPELDRVLKPRERCHYSNLAYMLLGEIVSRLAGEPFERVVDGRILQPLGMSRTTWTVAEPAARGYFVDPWDERLRPEPDVELGAAASAAALWSTTADLGRWAAFLCEPDATVLAPATVTEMLRPEMIADLESWRLAWGLGFTLSRRGDRIFAGHGGAMPGYLSGLAFRPQERLGAVVLTNVSSDADPETVALGLLEKTLELEPPAPEEWQPSDEAPAELAGILGHWWSEGTDFVFRHRRGKLEARIVSAPAAKPPAVFERVEQDVYRSVSGREQGETLRIIRDETGRPVKLYWATYAFTRDPRTF